MVFVKKKKKNRKREINMGVGLLWAKFEDEELVHNRSLDISKKKKTKKKTGA